MCNLADFYLKGRGVEQDDMQAYIWYSLGIRGGLDARQPRDALAARLKPEQVQEANDLVASWQPAKSESGK
jgi:TPR repeat protein